jgi:cytochrome c biogenesis protein CcdA
MSWNYAIAFLPLLAGAVAATQVASADVARLLIIFSLGLAFAVFAIVFVTKQRGRSRFRELWNEEHGGPVNPM